MGGWMDGWMGGKAGLRIAYSNQKFVDCYYCHCKKFAVCVNNVLSGSAVKNTEPSFIKMHTN
jgi:hypothetical protein